MISNQLLLAGGITIGPTTKNNNVTTTKAKAAAAAAAAAHNNTDHVVVVEDKAFLPVSLLGILALSEHGATRTIEKGTTTSRTTTTTADEDHRPQQKKLTPIDKMKLGEFGMNPPLVHLGEQQQPDSNDDADNCFIPNPFVMTEHWQAAICKYEQAAAARITTTETTNGPKSGPMEQQEEEDDDDPDKPTSSSSNKKMILYYPFARDMAAPVPVNERLFPDLYFGWGGAQCTHTHREIVQNRLLCILLNRLASNYHAIYNNTTTSNSPGRRQQQQQQPNHQSDDVTFIVRMSMDGRDMIRPHDLIEALIRSGNKIELVVTTHPTSFGAALCVKEEKSNDSKKGGNNKWSNIPLVTFVNSGYETANQEEAQALLPHSGLNLELHGPLIGCGERISIQHFIGIEGYCGWMSNHNANVPWLQDIACGPVVSRPDIVVMAARTAALYGLLLNIVGTEWELPFGGYGLVGVCNDSAAIMECILHGETHIYPLTAVGKYSVQVMRKAKQFQAVLQSTASGCSEEVKAIDDIIWAMKTLPSDIHACPICMVGAITACCIVFRPNCPSSS